MNWNKNGLDQMKIVTGMCGYEWTITESDVNASYLIYQEHTILVQKV